nr:MAG TPA: hypothetical protein [Caudoviricetes sp.]
MFLFPSYLPKELGKETREPEFIRFSACLSLFLS